MQLNTLSYVHNVCMCTREPIEYRQKRNLKYLNIHEHTHSKCVYGGCTCVAYFRIGIGIIFSVWDCRSLLLANHIRKLSWIITTLYVIVTIWPLFKWKVRLFSVFSRHFSFCVCFCFRIFISKRKLFIYVSIYYSFYGTCTSELNTTDSTHYKWSAPLTLGQICFFFFEICSFPCLLLLIRCAVQWNFFAFDCCLSPQLRLIFIWINLSLFDIDWTTQLML